MEVIYAQEAIPETVNKSIFLAGPTPRSDEVDSWREGALRILEEKGFDGVVFIPEPRSKEWHSDYDRQVNWEEDFLNIADCIVFWVPRNLENMPAFTTNVEFGAWCDSGKIVFGAPPDAPKNSYLKHYSEKYNVPMAESLEDTLDNAVKMLGDGAERANGEVWVPLFIWKTPSFQSWYRSQVDAGNKLQNAKLIFNFRPKYKSFVFMWILKVDVWVSSEKRSKSNEFVLARTDISSVLLWKKEKNLLDSKVILIKEFRSPANTSDGFIRELPGGSSTNTDYSPEETAAEEIFEETGFLIDPKRFKFHQARQLAATLSSHKAYFYSAELDSDELDYFKSQKDIVHGNINNTERTFVEVYSIKELMDNADIDWTTLGMILSAIKE
jgi:8-oxo-dGTP pyrophosphatase MutT (NUDIX family)